MNDRCIACSASGPDLTRAALRAHVAIVRVHAPLLLRASTVRRGQLEAWTVRLLRSTREIGVLLPWSGDAGIVS